MEKLKASAANVDAFIEKAKRYTTIDELTPELLRLFIQRIEVGEREPKVFPLCRTECQDCIQGHRQSGQSYAGGRARTAYYKTDYRY